jgi:hypothetical protein
MHSESVAATSTTVTIQCVEVVESVVGPRCGGWRWVAERCQPYGMKFLDFAEAKRRLICA